jgi:protein regulator of cytokinesis 1
LLISLRWLTLAQLYHTKLEQLIALTTRLVSMSRVVGDNFFPEDVLDPSAGRSPGALYQDVNPERFSKLEKELVRGKGEIVGYIWLPAPHSTY